MKIVSLFYLSAIGLIIFLANKGALPLWMVRCTEIPHGDSIGHFFLFGFFSVAVTLAFQFKRVSVFSTTLFLGTVITFIFVTIEEVFQIFLIHRTFSVSDLIADYAGLFVIGQLLCSVLYKNQKRMLYRKPVRF